MKTTSLLKLITIFLLGLLASACGYTWEGTNPSLPYNAQSIAIAPIRNETYQPGLDTALMRHLRQALRQNASVRLTSESQADLLIDIRLNQLEQQQASVSSDGLTVELQMTLTGDVTLIRRRNGKVMWNEPGMKGKNSLNFEQGEENRGLTTSTLNRGIEAVSADFSQAIYERLFFSF